MRTTAFIVFLMIGFCSAVIYRLNDTDHDRMPPIVHLDPFERCLHQPGGVYCTAFISFVADELNALLTQMQEYSEYTIRHFNYTRALYGTCVSDRCTSEKNMDPKRTLETCLNRTVWNNYKLKVKIEDGLYCVDRNNRKLPLDIAGITIIAIVISLFMLNAVGSLYDFYFLEKKHGPATHILFCFSLRRNWRDLVSSSDNSKDPRERSLQGIYGIRAISMILVVQAHAVLYPLIITDNPMFFEKQYEILPMHLVMNGTLIMQTFLILSAFLLVYNALKAEEKHETSWKLLPMKIFKRWLRLTPPYALLLGVTATWLNNTGNGPLWGFLVTDESRDCRRDWWRYLLYINNYFDSSRCMPQAWYLAADFQLYCLGMTVYTFCKSLTSRKVVISVLFLIGLVIPGLHTYFQDLDANVIVTPNAAASTFVSDPTFNHVQKRGHTNLSGYMLGLALGYLVHKLQKNNIDVKNNKICLLIYWAMFPLSFGIILLCKFFYAEGTRMDVCWRVIIASFIRPTFGFTMAVILAGTILKIDNVYRAILEWRGWTTLARVSYSAYILHVAFVRVLGGMQATTVPGTYMSIAQTILFMTVLTYLAAYIYHLTVEVPLKNVVKLWLEPRVRQKTE